MATSKKATAQSTPATERGIKMSAVRELFTKGRLKGPHAVDKMLAGPSRPQRKPTRETPVAIFMIDRVFEEQTITSCVTTLRDSDIDVHEVEIGLSSGLCIVLTAKDASKGVHVTMSLQNDAARLPKGAL